MPVNPEPSALILAARPATPNLTKHSSLYLIDESVTFIVEDTSFRLPTYFFKRDSPIFRKQFEESDTTTASVHGIIPDSIRLQDVTVQEFERFVRVLYPSNIGEYDATTTEDWTSILQLADRWRFASICRLAISKIKDNANPADQIIIGQKFNVEELYHRGLVEICMRKSALTEEEGNKLGMRRVIAIAAARQWICVKPSAMQGYTESQIINFLRNNFPRCFGHPERRS
ncbi:hypothetical protein AX16_003426 [Volvariella volvacea WC 439]|nr:hypothetical protein AX16_003426 [Volvariella volvacea WC 439]